MATAATVVCVGAHLVAATVDYVRQREQFGRAVGSLQAVQHQLSNARISGACLAADAMPW
ncbi:MAG: acyl-CoA dehydrogenase family protein [Mycobacterium sp.]